MAPLFALAMGLHSQTISAPEFYRQDAMLKVQIMAAMDQSAYHLGIRRLG
jgi:hypothetical protein